MTKPRCCGRPWRASSRLATRFVTAALGAASPALALEPGNVAGEPVTVDVEGNEVTLSPEELLVEPKQREGYALEREAGLSVALSTTLDRDLLDEGLVRELVHRVQNLRREKGFEIEEGVWMGLSGSPRVARLLKERWGDYFKVEVLARKLALDESASEGDFESVTVDGEVLRARIEPLKESRAG